MNLFLQPLHTWIAAADSLRMMLNPSPPSRPPPSAFSSSPYFQEDKHVRALVFLDSLVKRDDVQKTAFLRDLDSFWVCLHARVIRYKVCVLHQLFFLHISGTMEVYITLLSVANSMCDIMCEALPSAHAKAIV